MHTETVKVRVDFMPGERPNPNPNSNPNPNPNPNQVDPDVPFRDSPTDGEWLHWLVYDIPG